MNKVILIGRLTRDPELRTTTSGIATSTFSLAVQRPFTNQSGTRDADFINCVVWRRQAENVVKYCGKGSQVAVEGRIQVRNYDADDGTKRYVTEVICDNVTFLGSKPSGGSSYSNEASSNYQSFGNNNSNNETQPTTDISEEPFKDFGEEIVLSDDDLPF